MAEISPNLKKPINPQIQEIQQTPDKTQTHTSTHPKAHHKKIAQNQ